MGGFINASGLKLCPMVVPCCDTSPNTCQNNAKNGTPKEDPWCWCHCFCLDQVPPSICLDQGEVPKPQDCQRLEGCKTLQQEVKKINQKDQLLLVITHKDFLDANGNLHELYAVKKHFGIQEEGDSDFFFDVTQETQQEQQDELLPAAIDSELSGENHGST